MRKFNLGILGMLGILVLVVFASGCTSSDNGTTSNQQSPTNSSSSPSSSSSSSSSSSDSVNAVINYSGEWSGAVADSTGTRTISGSGTKTINLGSITGAVAVNAQKQDAGSGTLTLSITSGGKTLATQSTSSQYGVVQVSASV